MHPSMHVLVLLPLRKGLGGETAAHRALQAAMPSLFQVWWEVGARPGSTHKQADNCVQTYGRLGCMCTALQPGALCALECAILGSNSSCAHPPSFPASGSSTGTRLIPLEAVYIIFNVGMSKDFSGWVDFDNLPFPSEMLVDYIRCEGGQKKLGRVTLPVSQLG